MLSLYMPLAAVTDDLWARLYPWESLAGWRSSYGADAHICISLEIKTYPVCCGFMILCDGRIGPIRAAYFEGTIKPAIARTAGTELAFGLSSVAGQPFYVLCKDEEDIKKALNKYIVFNQGKRAGYILADVVGCRLYRIMKLSGAEMIPLTSVVNGNTNAHLGVWMIANPDPSPREPLPLGEINV